MKRNFDDKKNGKDEEKMKTKFNGHHIQCNLKYADLRGEIAGYFEVPKTDVSDGLVKYNSRSNTVTVDQAADSYYSNYAAIHECICCGPYKELAPKTHDLKRRCGLIDKMIIESMPESERKPYTAKRIEMFENRME